MILSQLRNVYLLTIFDLSLAMPKFLLLKQFEPRSFLYNVVTYEIKCCRRSIYCNLVILNQDKIQSRQFLIEKTPL